MKGLKKIRGCWNLWDFLMTLGFALCIYGWTWDKSNPVQEILGGVPYEEGGELLLLPLGKWHILFGFFFFILCRGMLADSRFVIFEKYRYGSFRGWWRVHFWTLHLKNSLTFLTAYLLWGLLGKLDMQAGAALVFYLHLGAMVSILIAADYFRLSGVAPCILIVAEGVCYVLSVRHHLSWLACGMYTRSVFERADGFPAWILAAEVLLTGLCWVLVPVLHDRGFGGG